ncbi:DUF2961 domain-containing protein [bacterium]|nr:DUF2961 domain-containing protein [bacterium]
MSSQITCILVIMAWSTASLIAAPLPQTSEPPIVPVGLDAYRMWDRLPCQRIGVRAYMRSTYDREGNNRAADASHFLYQEREDWNTTLDVVGPGCLYFKRTNHWHGSPWHYEVDGSDTIVKETATADPMNAKKNLKHTTFIPEDLFPNPLTWTWTTTKGADLMWVPLGFEKSLRIAYSRTHYGTGYYIYHLYTPGMKNLSRPLKSWDRTPPDPAVLALLARAGEDIAPSGPGVTKKTGTLSLEAGQWTTLVELDAAPATLRALKFSLPREHAYNFGQGRLRITWDRRYHPSIDAPLALFFGAGHLYNNNDREWLVKGFPMNIRFASEVVELACYYPMPFFRHARIEIENRSARKLAGVTWEIRSVPLEGPINHVAYFHATYTDHPYPVQGEDNVFLDTSQVEGGGPWSGSFVGMSWIFSREGYLGTLEGDPRILLDDSKTPQGWGTGTEEWGGGGDYWGGVNMTLPFAGYPVGTDRRRIQDEKDLVNSAYRFLIADHFPFGRRAVVRLEHGAVNSSTEHYSGVAYWYGVDSPSLVLSDHFFTCADNEVREHEYVSPTAGAPYTLVSRYELGPDHQAARMYFPAEEDQTRTMKGESTFKMRLDPVNLGAMLRRKFDYGHPNQKAKVYVRADGASEWNYVGEWYDSGSNVCVYSNPRGDDYELKPAEHNVIEGNRRWRESEFLLPREYTEGVKRLEIRIVHVPVERELFPGHPFHMEPGRIAVLDVQPPNAARLGLD